MVITTLYRHVEVKLDEKTQDKDIHGKTLHGNMLNILPVSGRGNANLLPEGRP